MKQRPTTMFTFTTFVVSMLVIGCRSPKDAQVDLRSVIESRLGQAYDTISNQSKSHLLAQQRRQSDHSQQTIRYLVIRLSNKKIVKEGTYQNGFARWFSDHELEIIETTTREENKRHIIPIDSES